MSKNISIYVNYIVNIKYIPKEYFDVKLPFDPSIYGNLSRKPYTMNDNADIINEPKLLTMPFLTINLTNNQFTPFQSDLGYLINTKNVMINQNLDLYYKSKVWYDNYGLGDNGGKFYVSNNESVDEMPLITNAYTQYIQNNKTQSAFFYPNLIAEQTIGNASGALQALMIGGTMSGVPAMLGAGIAIAGTAQGVLNKIIQRQDLKNVPNSLRNAGNNLLYDYGNNNIKLFTYSVKPQQQFLNRAWKYLFRYGYTCNDFKIPDLRSRYFFNYIKTTDANLDADIPKAHLMTLKNIFNKGTTIWHVRDDNLVPVIGDYSKENMEVSLNA